MQSPEPPSGKDAPPRRKEASAPDGVDVTLIRWMLSLSPRQRLLVLQRNLRSIRRLRGARSRVVS